jgi:hypothetical protein
MAVDCDENYILHVDYVHLLQSSNSKINWAYMASVHTFSVCDSYKTDVLLCAATCSTTGKVFFVLIGIITFKWILKYM